MESQLITLQLPNNNETVESLLRALIEQNRQAIDLLTRLVEQREAPTMLTHKQAAAHLSIHPSTLYLLDGSLPVYKIRGKRLYKRTDLDAWLEKSQEEKGKDKKANNDEH